MPVSFLSLTDTDEIRATIGVDSTDLADSIITDRHPEDDLEADLLTWFPLYQTTISEGAAVAATAEQALKYLKLKLYSKYFLSATVASAGMLSILQKQSDGANEAIRFTNVKINDLVNHLQRQADRYRSELEVLISGDANTGPSLFGIVTPSFDPVTNE